MFSSRNEKDYSVPVNHRQHAQGGARKCVLAKVIDRINSGARLEFSIDSTNFFLSSTIAAE